jgi:hypothetical protein
MRPLVLLGLALAGLTAAGLLLGLPLDMDAADLLRVHVLVALLMAVALYFLAVRQVLRRAWPRGQSGWSWPSPCCCAPCR